MSARHVMVRYKVKPGRVEEHEALIAGVFAELEATGAAGIRYAAFKQADGVSFVHLATIAGKENPLDDSPAFAAFTENIGERCSEKPKALPYTEVAAYTASR